MNDFLTLNFEITSFCNAKCTTCFRTIHLDRLPLKHLDIDDFQDFIFTQLPDIKSKYKVTAKFCGEVGDPLMHPMIDDLIGIANKTFHSVELFTNGGLRRPQWFRKMLWKNSKLTFVFGIDGLTHRVNSKYRKNVNTKLAFENMLASSGVRYTRWDYTIFPHNIHQVPDVIFFAQRNSIDLVMRFDGRGDEISQPDIIAAENFIKQFGIYYYKCK